LPAIFGLGNPGPKYRGTRHNVGFEVVDEIARRWDISSFETFGSALYARARSPLGGDPVVLAKPMTYMNASGEAVAGLAAFYKIDPGELLVVVDEVQLPLGRLRLRPSGSAGGHNGLKSIVQYLGPGFPRLRLGVGRGDPRWDLADHVLSRFSSDERLVIDRAIARAADAAETFLTEGIEAAMNKYNAPEVAPGASGPEDSGTTGDAGNPEDTGMQ
jgi:PTH1 family peptidyl-tRNA hydrolase